MDYNLKDDYIKYSAMVRPIGLVLFKDKVEIELPVTINQLEFKDNLFDPINDDEDDAETFFSVK